MHRPTEERHLPEGLEVEWARSLVRGCQVVPRGHHAAVGGRRAHQDIALPRTLIALAPAPLSALALTAAAPPLERNIVLCAGAYTVPLFGST